jgi:hypothetical protein
VCYSVFLSDADARHRKGTALMLQLQLLGICHKRKPKQGTDAGRAAGCGLRVIALLGSLPVSWTTMTKQQSGNNGPITFK